MADNECCFVGQNHVTRGFCVCCVGPDIRTDGRRVFVLTFFFVFC